MKYSSAVLALICLAGLAIARCQAVTYEMPNQCESDFVGEVPFRIRKVCSFLSSLHQVAASLENYLNEKAPMWPEDMSRIPLRDSSVKRQDVDHVFLRFGKR